MSTPPDIRGECATRILQLCRSVLPATLEYAVQRLIELEPTRPASPLLLLAKLDQLVDDPELRYFASERATLEDVRLILHCFQFHHSVALSAPDDEVRSLRTHLASAPAAIDQVRTALEMMARHVGELE